MDRRENPPGAWWTRLDEQRMTATVEDSDGNEKEVPFTWVVCGTCDGRGSYVNPAIDSHGIGAEEWERDWDEDERDGYFSGRYDVGCAECDGRRVVPEVPEDDPFYAELQERLKADADFRRCQAAERAMGA